MEFNTREYYNAVTVVSLAAIFSDVIFRALVIVQFFSKLLICSSTDPLLPNHLLIRFILTYIAKRIRNLTDASI